MWNVSVVAYALCLWGGDLTMPIAQPKFIEIREARKVDVIAPVDDLKRYFPSDADLARGIEINRSMKWKTYGKDIPTEAHENNHFLNGILGNIYSEEAGKPKTVFYLGQGRVVVFDTPKVRKSGVRARTPALEGVWRHDTYIAKKYPSELRDSKTGRVTGWVEDANDYFPMTLFDEWVAYRLDTLQAIYMAKQGVKRTEIGIGADALPEFAYFCTSLMMEIKEKDPRAYRQIAPFFVWMHRESAKVYAEAVSLEEIRPDDKTRKGVLSDPKADKHRRWLKEQFSLDFAELYPGK